MVGSAMEISEEVEVVGGLSDIIFNNKHVL